jgi:hypothetical protein
MKNNNNILASHIELEQNKKTMTKQEKKKKNNMMTKCESKMKLPTKTTIGWELFLFHIMAKIKFHFYFS